jgi:nucleoside-diphosphate-sugar epimerase
VKILLVGHEGYIGSGLERALRSRHEVVGWGRAADITTVDASVVRDRAIEAVVNCAAVIDRRTAELVPGSPTYRVNVDGARALVEALRGTNVRLIQISTREVYGPVYGPDDVVGSAERATPKFFVDEERPLAPVSAYGKSKLMAESIVEAHPASAVVRLSTCYTEHAHARGGWILNMLKARFRGEPIVIEGTGKQVRDPLHVDDLAGLIDLILSGDPARTAGRPLNAGGGPDNVLSILEIARLIDPRTEIRWAAGGDHGFVLDDRRASESVGWRPAIRFADRIDAIRANVWAALRDSARAAT